MTPKGPAAANRPEVRGSGPPIDPRILARLVAVRKDQRRRRRWALGTLGALTGVLVAIWGLGRTPLLSVQRVNVAGAGHTPKASIVAAAGLGHRPMLEVSPDRLRARLKALPWVLEASVRRQWPSTVDIRISERQPAAEISGPGGQPALVDGTGRVLAAGPDVAALPAALLATVPRLEGTFVAGPIGRGVGHGPAAGLRVAVALASQFASPPSGGAAGGAVVALRSVVVGPGDVVSARLSDGSSVIFGSIEQLDAKLVAVRAVFQKVPIKTPVVVDVRVPDSPVLTPAGLGSMVSTVPRG